MGTFLQIREGYVSKREGIGYAFQMLCPSFNGPLNPTVPVATRIWENFAIFIDPDKDKLQTNILLI